MSKLNWERAAQEDYIASHGSIPHWVDAQGDSEDRREQQKVDLRVRLQATCLKVVAEFAELTDFERRRRYEAFRSRLCATFDSERGNVGQRTRLEEAVADYEKGALALLKGLLPSEQLEYRRSTGRVGDRRSPTESRAP